MEFFQVKYFESNIFTPIPAPSNRSPLVAVGNLKVSGGDLLEGSGIYDPGTFWDHFVGPFEYLVATQTNISIYLSIYVLFSDAAQATEESASLRLQQLQELCCSPMAFVGRSLQSFDPLSQYICCSIHLTPGHHVEGVAQGLQLAL